MYLSEKRVGTTYSSILVLQKLAQSCKVQLFVCSKVQMKNSKGLTQNRRWRRYVHMLVPRRTTVLSSAPCLASAYFA